LDVGFGAVKGTKDTFAQTISHVGKGRLGVNGVKGGTERQACPGAPPLPWGPPDALGRWGRSRAWGPRAEGRRPGVRCNEERNRGQEGWEGHPQMRVYTGKAEGGCGVA
jgi:hypothetical protein